MMAIKPVKKPTAGSVLRIERSSIHDGQGLRTVIFLKGCPLNCAWCSTPESKNNSPEKGYAAEQCRGCGRCVDSCPCGAIYFETGSRQVRTDPAKCSICFHCVKICPAGAIKKYGSTLTVPEVMRQVTTDEVFYFHSGGGVTLSGGEPLNQAAFSAEVLKECKALGINTAMESCFYSDYKNIEMILPWLDTLYVDLKHLDSVVHEEWIGSDNRLILDNIIKADRGPGPLAIVVRVPLVPGFNDSDQNLLSTLRFCMKLNRLKEIEILPYHRLGSETYVHLGLDYSCRDLKPPTAELLLERVSFMKRQGSGIDISAGSGFTSG